MKQATVLKRIESEKKRVESIGRTFCGLPGRYRKRTNDFVSPNWDFSADTMLGHSYRWYELVKEIRGVVVLNSYRYSSSTSKHVGNVRSILRALKIKHVEVEAPRGLQDLNLSATHTLKEIARLELKMKFERGDKRWSQGRLNSLEKEFTLLTKNLKAKPLLSRKDCAEIALGERTDKLARNKKRRAELTAKAIAKTSAPIPTAPAFAPLYLVSND